MRQRSGVGILTPVALSPAGAFDDKEGEIEDLGSTKIEPPGEAQKTPD